jgi:hypothetical protein
MRLKVIQDKLKERAMPDYLRLLKTVNEGMEAITYEQRQERYARTVTPMVIYYGIIAYSWPQVLSGVSPEDAFQEMDALVNLVSLITPRQFMGVFPISKEYHGEKLDMRDYWTTLKDAIEPNKLDKPIQKPFEFLTNYWNDDVLDFVVNMTIAMNHMRKEKKGKSLFDQFLEDNGWEMDWGNHK